MKSRKQSRYTAQSDNDSCASVTQRCVSVNMNGIPWGIPHTGMSLPPGRLISHVRPTLWNFVCYHSFSLDSFRR